MPHIALHEEIAAILSESGRGWMTTTEIADEVNRRSTYHKRDGSLVSPFQVHGRTRNYATLFDRDGSRVRLRRAAPPSINRDAASSHSPRRHVAAVHAPGLACVDKLVAHLTDPASRLPASGWPGSVAIDGAGL